MARWRRNVGMARCCEKAFDERRRGILRCAQNDGEETKQEERLRRARLARDDNVKQKQQKPRKTNGATARMFVRRLLLHG
jgi:hypothetical protein